MHNLSQDDFKALMERQEGPCVSLFMPTFRSGDKSQQNQIRFKNLLRRAEEKLAEAGLKAQECKEFLEQAQSLAGNVLFWRRQSDGLVLFLSKGLFRCYVLPESFEESITVADRFTVRPLLPLMSGDSRFYILALSQKSVRLFEATRKTIQEIELESLPKNLAEALQYDEFARQVRFATSSSGGERPAMVSGHGADLSDAKEDLLKYFRAIDRGLHDLLRDERAPLVLAGVDYLFPIYREANTYPRLLEEGIPGNPQAVSAETLHRQALKIVTPLFNRAQTEALAKYRQSLGTGLASADVREIVPAAFHGRVGLLFVAADRRCWGRFERGTGTVEVTDKPGGTTEDLLETAAVQTYLSGGDVFLLPSGTMPEARELVALFRY